MLGHLRCPHRTGRQHTGDPNPPGLAAWNQIGNPRAPQMTLDTDIQTTESQYA